MPTMVITRPFEDAAPLASELADIGIETIVAPLMVIEVIPGPEIDLAGVQGVLFTSANGARAFAARSSDRDIPVYAVGDATARASKDLKFKNVTTASGDVTTWLRWFAGHVTLIMVIYCMLVRLLLQVI